MTLPNSGLGPRRRRYPVPAPAPAVDTGGSGYGGMRKADLVKQAQSRGLPSDGTKQVLVDRLKADDLGTAQPATEAVDAETIHDIDAPGVHDIESKE